jgi:hypothetical protein
MMKDERGTMNEKRFSVHRSAFIVSSSSLIPAFVCLLVLCAAEARAQQDVVLPAQPAPPPMKYIPDAVRAQLNAARDAKARTRLVLELADARLASTETRTAAQQYDAAAAELGIYQALVTDALVSLQQTGKSDGKTRDLFKLVEQALFSYTGRIEAVRRNTPSEYIANIKDAIIHTRDTRATTLNAFYGNTVLREETPDKNKPAPKEPTPEKPAPAPINDRSNEQP